MITCVKNDYQSSQTLSGERTGSFGSLSDPSIMTGTEVDINSVGRTCIARNRGFSYCLFISWC